MPEYFHWVAFILLCTWIVFTGGKKETEEELLERRPTIIFIRSIMSKGKFLFILMQVAIVAFALGSNIFDRWQRNAAYVSTLSLLKADVNADVKRYMESIPCVLIVRSKTEMRQLHGELTCSGVYSSVPLLIPPASFTDGSFEKFVSFSNGDAFVVTSIYHPFTRESK